jgi:transcriptional regulator with XRE-family HTH domain
MAFIHKNLRYLRQQQAWTQKQLAEILNVKQPVVGAYEEERATPPLFTLTRIAEVFSISLDALVQSDLSKPTPAKPQTPAKVEREVSGPIISAPDKGSIELVPQKAAAGYLAGYQDPEFMQELPKISMPMLPRNKVQRAFEIQGDSMLPVRPGTLVFGEYVEKLTDIKNGKSYVAVTKCDGIVFKRIFRFSEYPSSVLFVSDNPLYEPYVLPSEELLELWRVNAYFSKESPAEHEGTSSLAERMALMIIQSRFPEGFQPLEG